MKTNVKIVSKKRRHGHKYLPSFFSFFIFVVFLFQSLAQVQAKEPNWDNYNYLLKTYVKAGQTNQVDLMTVDYIGMKNDVRYDKVINQIASYNLSNLGSKKEKLAFYINAYNILAIKMVLDHWPVKSIKDIGSFFSPVWKKDVGKIEHKTTSLHIIEHEILRKMDEPRIHVAIVCASVSCPDLRAEAYTAQKLDVQLTEQAEMFLANRMKGLYIKGNTVYVSKIFDWFEDDFDHVGGVKSFVRKYNKNITTNMKIDADIDYDWQLNKK